MLHARRTSESDPQQSFRQASLPEAVEQELEVGGVLERQLLTEAGKRGVRLQLAQLGNRLRGLAGGPPWLLSQQPGGEWGRGDDVIATSDVGDMGKPGRRVHRPDQLRP